MTTSPTVPSSSKVFLESSFSELFSRGASKLGDQNAFLSRDVNCTQAGMPFRVKFCILATRNSPPDTNFNPATSLHFPTGKLCTKVVNSPSPSPGREGRGEGGGLKSTVPATCGGSFPLLAGEGWGEGVLPFVNKTDFLLSDPHQWPSAKTIDFLRDFKARPARTFDFHFNPETRPETDIVASSGFSRLTSNEKPRRAALATKSHFLLPSG